MSEGNGFEEFSNDISTILTPSGTINITENGTVDVTEYAEADVAVPQPSGKITITENGDDIDVSSYALADVDVEQGVSIDEDYTISQGKLTTAAFTPEQGFTAYIPNNVTILGSQAFQYNTLITNVEMPNSVLTIENGDMFGPVEYGCFYSCVNLTNIKLSENLTSIGTYAFKNCTSLTTLTIPNSVTSIGNSSFKGCTGLTSIIIGDSVTIIDNNAFNGCTGLTSITIPKGVTSIGSGAFSNCTGLSDIYYTGTQAEWEQIDDINYAGIPQGCTIHYEYTAE